jgi:hypothetical protein
VFHFRRRNRPSLMLSWPRPSSRFPELLASATLAEITRRLILFIAFYPVVFSDMVSLRCPYPHCQPLL